MFALSLYLTVIRFKVIEQLLFPILQRLGSCQFLIGPSAANVSCDLHHTLLLY